MWFMIKVIIDLRFPIFTFEFNDIAHFIGLKSFPWSGVGHCKIRDPEESSIETPISCFHDGATESTGRDPSADSVKR